VNSRENTEYLNEILNHSEIVEFNNLNAELETLNETIRLYSNHSELTEQETAALSRIVGVKARLKELKTNQFIHDPQNLFKMMLRTTKMSFKQFRTNHPTCLSIKVHARYHGLTEKIEFLAEVLKQKDAKAIDYRIACYGLYGMIACFNIHSALPDDLSFNIMLDDLLELLSNAVPENGANFELTLAKNFYLKLVAEQELLKFIELDSLQLKDEQELDAALLNLENTLEIYKPTGNPELVKHAYQLMADIKEQKASASNIRHYYTRVISAAADAISAVGNSSLTQERRIERIRHFEAFILPDNKISSSMEKTLTTIALVATTLFLVASAIILHVPLAMAAPAMAAYIGLSIFAHRLTNKRGIAYELDAVDQQLHSSLARP
jgi:hypothetical protein